ncbi:gly-x carboxypeptidase [Mycena olivaceomarginata]|nr:gly-x carboxypeptidase [Mycena olivaceomarginata]
MRGLPLDDEPPRRFTTALARMLAFLVLLAAAGLLLAQSHFSSSLSLAPSPGRTSPRDFQRLPVSCPAQFTGLAPELQFDIPAPGDAQRQVYVDRLRGAVRVPTETFDGAPTDGADEWYDKFYKFEAYLKQSFPDVFGSLKLEHFATHGLLLTWAGSDASLAPLVLMAHQDTVPVPAETTARWTHPPFDAVFDEDGWIWGRGAGDCKNLLIAHLSAVSALLSAGFEPTRTVHLAFGFDEEGGGVHSARYIAAHLEDVYGIGQDSVFMIVDEGGGLISDYFGRTWVAPSLGEKGSVNVHVSVNVPGGHSSIPPAHTAIGILSALVTTIEAHPAPLKLSKSNPFAAFAQCLGEYGTIDDELKGLLKHERTWPEAAELMAARSPGDAARLSTTQAVDIVGGGVKVNALPEEAHVVVNHRLSVDDSISGLYERYGSLLTPEAAKFNLSVVGFGESPPAGVDRYVQLSSPRGAEVSPVTPAEGAAWEIFSRTSTYLWPDAIVAPYLSTGGTDTRSYVNLTRAIFRFQGVRDDEKINIHTVDERVHVNGHLNTIAWVHALVQNADKFRK